MLRPAGALREGRGATIERLTRALWTWACVWLWIHVACAFHFVHHWSQSEAVAHTARQTEAVVGRAFGVGTYVNYVVMALWTIDVAWWWIDPLSHAGRSRWIDRGWQAFLAFIVFNAAVVFESGPVRWGSQLGFGVLGWLWWPLWPLSDRATRPDH